MQQLKKDAFGWTTAIEKTFQLLKLAMLTVPILAFPNFPQPFIIELDTSGYDIEEILLQNHRPITYFR